VHYLCFNFFKSHVFEILNKYYTQYRYLIHYIDVYVYICLFSQGMLQRLNRISYHSINIYLIQTLNGEYLGILILDPCHIFNDVPLYTYLFRIMSTIALNQFPQKTMSTYNIHKYIYFFYRMCRLFSVCRSPDDLFITVIHEVSSLYISSDYQIPNTNHQSLDVMYSRI